MSDITSQVASQQNSIFCVDFDIVNTCIGHDNYVLSKKYYI